MEAAPLRDAVARHYDELDPFYRALWGEHLHHGLWERGDETPEQAVVALALRVARAARIETGGARVVDIGCGYGATARLLHDRFGAGVTGITLSPVQQAYAQAAARPGADVRFVLGDWLENGLPDGAFDAAIAIESTEHMEDKPAVYAEAARVLRPGGRIAVCAWVRSPAATSLQRRHLLDPIVREGRLASLDTAEDHVAWLRHARFVEIRVTDLTSQVATTWGVCLRRIGRELRQPSTWRYLLGGAHTERSFAVTVVRMALAYRTGALEYVLLSATAGGA